MSNGPFVNAPFCQNITVISNGLHASPDKCTMASLILPLQVHALDQQTSNSIAQSNYVAPNKASVVESKAGLGSQSRRACIG